MCAVICVLGSAIVSSHPQRQSWGSRQFHRRRCADVQADFEKMDQLWPDFRKAAAHLVSPSTLKQITANPCGEPPTGLNHIRRAIVIENRTGRVLQVSSAAEADISVKPGEWVSRRYRVGEQVRVAGQCVIADHEHSRVAIPCSSSQLIISCRLGQNLDPQS